MKSGKYSILFSILCATMLIAGNALAGAVEIWDSNGLSGMGTPSNLRLHGFMLVWQARGGLSGTSSGKNDLEIFCCNLETMEVRQITDDNNDDTHPETDGRYVVWQKYVRGSGSSIYLFDALYGSSAGGTRISSSSNGDSYMPYVSNGHVVWTAQKVDRVYRPGTIRLFSPATDSAPKTISTSGADGSNPFIYRNRVVWTQTDTDGYMLDSGQWQYDLSLYDPAAEPLPAWVNARRSTSSDGQYSVFVKNDGNGDEVFLLGQHGEIQQLTDDDTGCSEPVMSQNHVAWIAGSTIIAADISDMLKVNGLNAVQARARYFVLRWKRLFPEGVEAYHIDLSTHPDFIIPVPGYTDRSVGNRSYYRVRGLRPDTTYYFRIRAIVNGSTTADSEAGSIKTARQTTTTSWWLSRLRSYKTIYYQRLNTIRTYFSTLFTRLSRLFHGIF